MVMTLKCLTASSSLEATRRDYMVAIAPALCKKENLKNSFNDSEAWGPLYAYSKSLIFHHMVKRMLWKHSVWFL